jgi:2-methylcitrate dehydratase PrpD
MNVTTELARFVSNHSFSMIPPHVRALAIHTIIDTLGCCIAGHTEAREECEWITRMVQDLGGVPECSVFTQGFRTSAPLAALANGTMIHSIDFDDTHMGSISHFSASLVPTIFALGERLRADGPSLLEAFVVGFEVGGKVGRQMMPSHYRYWHPTATFGSLASAAAAAKLLHFNDLQTEQVLGLAADQAAGLRYCIDKGDYSKSLHPGFAAMRGVMLSFLVQRGANGPQGILEYPTGFCRAFSEAPQVDRITDALGQPYEICSNSLKAFPTILISHTPIQAVLNIMKAHAIDHMQIERIHLTIASTAKGQGQNYDPQTPLAARLSIPFSVAVAAIDKEVSIGQFTAERLKDPTTRDLMKRIEIQEDASLNERYPETLASAVKLETKAKSALCDEVIYPRGNARNPMTREDVTNKFRALCSVSIPEERCERILQRLLSLEQADSLGELCDLLRG